MAYVAVFGASGRQGLAQVRQLSRAGHRVRALSRSPDPFCGERFDDVEVVPADVEDNGSLDAALAGVDTAFYNHPVRFGDRVGWVERVGHAARRARLKRLVWNTSTWIPDRPGDPGNDIYRDNTRAINALWRTGASATVLGSVLFMDNLLTNWAFDFIVRGGRYVYPHNPFLQANWISLDDVAKCMIAALDREDMEGAWLNIGGPERLTPPQVAEILSDTLGRPIRYDPCTPAQFGKSLADAFGPGMAPDAHAALARQIENFYIYNNFAPTKPFVVNVEAMLERIPVKLETMRQWASRQDWSMTNAPRPPAG